MLVTPPAHLYAAALLDAQAAMQGSGLRWMPVTVTLPADAVFAMCVDRLAKLRAAATTMEVDDA